MGKPALKTVEFTDSGIDAVSVERPSCRFFCAKCSVCNFNPVKGEYIFVVGGAGDGVVSSVCKEALYRKAGLESKLGKGSVESECCACLSASWAECGGSFEALPFSDGGEALLESIDDMRADKWAKTVRGFDRGGGSTSDFYSGRSEECIFSMDETYHARWRVIGHSSMTRRTASVKG